MPSAQNDLKMNTARKGRKFEWRVRDDLARDGAFIIRSAASKGPADLIALWKENQPPWLITCKSNGYIAKSEREHLIEIASLYKCIAVLATPPSRRGLYKWINYRALNEVKTNE